jgi:hypothetical protein
VIRIACSDAKTEWRISIMIRNGFGAIARWAVPAAILLLAGASAGNAAPLSPAGHIDPLTTSPSGLVHQVREGDQRNLERMIRRQDLQQGGSGLRYRRDGRRHYRDGRRHYRYGRRHRSNSGVFIGIVPNYYGYGYSRPRYSGGSCGYWSRRCGANWGWNNSSYYGCLRYHGC